MRFLKLKEVMQKTAPATSRIYRKMNNDEFPKSICLGDRDVVWLEVNYCEIKGDINKLIYNQYFQLPRLYRLYSLLCFSVYVTCSDYVGSIVHGLLRVITNYEAVVVTSSGWKSLSRVLEVLDIQWNLRLLIYSITPYPQGQDSSEIFTEWAMLDPVLRQQMMAMVWRQRKYRKLCSLVLLVLTMSDLKMTLVDLEWGLKRIIFSMQEAYTYQ